MTTIRPTGTTSNTTRDVRTGRREGEDRMPKKTSLRPSQQRDLHFLSLLPRLLLPRDLSLLLPSTLQPSSPHKSSRYRKTRPPPPAAPAATSPPLPRPRLRRPRPRLPPMPALPCSL